MRISVDQDLCLASGHCAMTVPEVFDRDDDGVVVALVTSAPPEHEARVQQAADLCPARAISVLND